MYIIGHLSIVGQFLIYTLAYLEPSGRSYQNPRLLLLLRRLSSLRLLLWSSALRCRAVTATHSSGHWSAKLA